MMTAEGYVMRVCKRAGKFSFLVGLEPLLAIIGASLGLRRPARLIDPCASHRASACGDPDLRSAPSMPVFLCRASATPPFNKVSLTRRKTGGGTPLRSRNLSPSAATHTLKSASSSPLAHPHQGTFKPNPTLQLNVANLWLCTRMFNGSYSPALSLVSSSACQSYAAPHPASSLRSPCYSTQRSPAA